MNSVRLTRIKAFTLAVLFGLSTAAGPQMREISATLVNRKTNSLAMRDKHDLIYKSM